MSLDASLHPPEAPPQTASLFAEYNRWMNDRLYAAAATLEPAALTADKGAFFGSILGTLNHIAVADTIWLHRFAQHEAAFPVLWWCGRFRPG